jgi:Toprim domain
MVTLGPTIDRPILSLADLEAYDPDAPAGRTERRFRCPICTPNGRHLAVNTQTGAWWCHRCLNYGLIRERWRNQPGVAAFRSVRKAPQSTLTPRTPPKPPEPDKWSWRAFWDACEPVSYTPGAAYLRGRGIADELAYEAGIRYADQFAVQDAAGKEWRRPERCILFPFRDRAGQVVAVNIRFIDVPSSDQKRKTVTLGPRNLGAVMVRDPLHRDPIVVVEGPIDALSLTMVGVPALALVGTAGTGWLPEACVLRNVAIALDHDERGDGGAERLRGLLTPVGARLARWRPASKDWNDDLRAVGPDVLRERIETLCAQDFLLTK